MSTVITWIISASESFRKIDPSITSFSPLTASTSQDRKWLVKKNNIIPTLREIESILD